MSAILSHCGKYRYRLIRDLGMMGNGACCFVMLNPSTADATQDDPTIRRCMGYARLFNCARLEVVNIFAYRSTDPHALYGMSKPMAIGPDNDRHLIEVCKASAMVLCAWGNHGSLFGRGKEVLNLLADNGIEPQALKVNKATSQPAHPLYLKGDLRPMKFAVA